VSFSHHAKVFPAAVHRLGLVGNYHRGQQFEPEPNRTSQIAQVRGQYAVDGRHVLEKQEPRSGQKQLTRKAAPMYTKPKSFV
jgi:hypothetical protein